MPGIRLIRLGLTEAWKTQAVYHAVAGMMTEESPDTIILCRPDTPYLCLGYHQVFDDVFDAASCARLSLPVYRRKIGGGGTLLDSGQLFYQCVFHRNRVPAATDRLFAWMLEAPVRVLRGLGLDAELNDINEIRVDHKRIAGTGGGVIGDAVVVVGNILLSFQYDVLPQVWRATGSAPSCAMAGVALRAHLTTLRAQSLNIPYKDLENLLIGEFSRSLARPLFQGDLTLAEWTAALETRSELTSGEFLHCHPAETGGALMPRPLKIAAGAFLHVETVPAGGGMIHATLLVEDGVVTAASLESESARDLRTMEQKLHGVTIDRWRNALELPLEAA